MIPALEHALELVVVEAALCLLLVSFFFERTPTHEKYFGWIFRVLAVLAVANFFNFGVGEARRDGRQIHDHEQFHFYLGSKYLREVRYDALYDAAILAAVDEGLLPSNRVERRNLRTFGQQTGPMAVRWELRVRDRFTPERWQEFRRDTRELYTYKPAGSYVTDHGNTGSPAWAMTASLFTETFAYGRTTGHLFASLDLVLLALLFAMVGWAFGERVCALTMVVGLSVPLVYTYLGGSILRMDWIVALGTSVCLFEKRRFRAAGVLLGYAVASKPLAGVIVLPLALVFLVRSIRERSVDRGHLRYVAFAALGLVAFVLAAGLYFADPELWPDYVERLLLTLHEKHYWNNHSFRDLFLQLVHRTADAWNPLPRQVAAAHRLVFIEDVRGGFLAAQLVFVAGLVLVAMRHPVRFAFALGPLALFVLMVTNRYYWQVWTIPALVLAPTYRRDWRHTAFLAAILVWLGAGHILRLASLELDRSLGGYFGSYRLFWLGLAVMAVELIDRHRRRRPTRGPEA